MNTLVKLGLVFAAATALAGTVAKADTITATANNTPILGAAPIAPGNVSLSGAADGFNISGSALSTAFAQIPNVLITSVSAVGSGVSPLTITVTATNLPAFPSNLNVLQSSFSLTPVLSAPAGAASVVEQTFVNGSLAGSATFNAQAVLTAGSLVTATPILSGGIQSVVDQFVITPTASLPANSVFNMGINTLAVPGPIVGAGLPGLIAALGGLVAMVRRRRKQLA